MGDKIHSADGAIVNRPLGNKSEWDQLFEGFFFVLNCLRGFQLPSPFECNAEKILVHMYKASLVRDSLIDHFMQHAIKKQAEPANTYQKT